MESSAILKMFQRSVSKHGIYYRKYIGDGDSKTFPILPKISSYPGTIYFFYLKKLLSTVKA